MLPPLGPVHLPAARVPTPHHPPTGEAGRNGPSGGARGRLGGRHAQSMRDLLGDGLLDRDADLLSRPRRPRARRPGRVVILSLAQPVVADIRQLLEESFSQDGSA